MIKKLAIIILNWNGSNDTIECLESLDCNSIYDIYILDNNSNIENRNSLLSYLSHSKYCNVYEKININNKKISYTRGKHLFCILSLENMGFAKGNNYVVNTLDGKYDQILLLNNDTIVEGKAIEAMYEMLRDSSCIGLTCDIRLYDDKSELWNAGGIFTWYGDRKYYSQSYIDKIEREGKKIIYAEFITGCALLVKTEYICKYGLFTEKFFHGEEDFNFCIEAKKRGKLLGVCLSNRIYHKVGKSISRQDKSKNIFNIETVHFSNRIIDYKSIYGNNKWLLWRIMYITMIVIKKIFSSYGFTYGLRLAKRLYSITSKYNSVDKNLFDLIMRNDI